MTISVSPAALHRILIVAYACHPDQNMESRIGWKQAIAAAKQYQVTVLHGADHCSQDLADRAAAAGIAADRLQFVSVSSWFNRLPPTRDLVYWAGYRGWHAAALAIARRLHQANPFQLVHLVSFCGYREPGRWWTLAIPFIWGPVGGTHNFPMPFWRFLSTPAALREAARNVANRWQLRHSRRVRDAAQQAHTVFAATAQGQSDLQQATGIQPLRLLETAVDVDPQMPQRQLDGSRPFRILWSGRLCEWKALPVLLQALRDLDGQLDYELCVLGVGPAERRWRRLAQRYGIASRIDWCGWPAYQQGLQRYRWADLFAFTSLRDTSGTGLLESLAAGTPVVYFDHQGAADILNRDCSLPISLQSPANAAADFRQAIVRLASDPALWGRLSQAAWQRAQAYSWQQLSDQVDAVYHEALAQQPVGSAHPTQRSQRRPAVAASPTTLFRAGKSAESLQN